MRKIVKSITSICLILAIIVSIIPENVFADSNTINYDSYTTIIEATSDTTIRSEASQDSKVLAKIKKGDVLCSNGTVINRYGNIWFRVIVDSETVGYIYNEKVSCHTHQWKHVDGSDELYYCKCGSFTKSCSGNCPTTELVIGESPINVGELLVLGEAIKYGVKSAAVAVSIACPYLIVVGSIAGLTIIAAVTAYKGSISTEQVTTDWESLDEKYKPGSGYYSEGVLCDEKIIIAPIHMNLEQAHTVISIDIGYNTNLAKRNKKQCLWFIYTYTQKDAYALCTSYCEAHPCYKVSTEKSNPECHGNSKIKQFSHYHIIPSILPSNGFDNQTDHLGGHIIYGAPMCGEFNLGAWS